MICQWLELDERLIVTTRTALQYNDQTGCENQGTRESDKNKAVHGRTPQKVEQLRLDEHGGYQWRWECLYRGCAATRVLDKPANADA